MERFVFSITISLNFIAKCTAKCRRQVGDRPLPEVTMTQYIEADMCRFALSTVKPLIQAAP